jgi:hypothetical protein
MCYDRACALTHSPTGFVPTRGRVSCSWTRPTVTCTRSGPPLRGASRAGYDLLRYRRCRVWRPYNRPLAASLPPTWRDADARLLHVSFAILRDVVEKEDIFNQNAYEGGWMNALQEIARSAIGGWACGRGGRIRPIGGLHSVQPTHSRLPGRRSGPRRRSVMAAELIQPSTDMEMAQAAEDTAMLSQLPAVFVAQARRSAEPRSSWR